MINGSKSSSMRMLFAPILGEKDDDTTESKPAEEKKEERELRVRFSTPKKSGKHSDNDLVAHAERTLKELQNKLPVTSSHGITPTSPLTVKSALKSSPREHSRRLSLESRGIHLTSTRSSKRKLVAAPPTPTKNINSLSDVFDAYGKIMEYVS